MEIKLSRKVTRFDVPDADVNDQAWDFDYIKCRTMRHNSMGHWCGYIGVPLGTPYYGKNADDTDLHAHGGLTYASNHLPEAKPDGLWWFGFDCAHAGDLVPALSQMFPEGHRNDIYRDAAYVVEEVNRLAEQAQRSKAT